MANKIQVRRGIFANLPTLSVGEPAFCTDTKQLFVGDGTNNIEINSSNKEDMIINGGFDIWQRGTSQTISGYGSDDRWYNESATSNKTHSRQAFAVGQTEVPNNPTYFSRTAVTSVAGGYCVKTQRIEDVAKLSGKTMTLSFWAKADGNKKLCVEFMQQFGTGGSTGVGTIQPTTCNLTTTWKRFTVTVTLPSVSGKTIGAGNYTAVYFWFDAGTAYNARTNSIGQQTGTFDIANVTFVEGKTPKEWQPENLATLMTKCQRYYETSNGENRSLALNYPEGHASVFIHFKEKRCAPTIVSGPQAFIHYPGISAGWHNFSGLGNIKENSATIDYSTGATHSLTGECVFSWSADAEL